MNVHKIICFSFLLTIIQANHTMKHSGQDDLIKAIAALALHDIHDEIQNQFDLLFTMHLELIRDKIREVFILLPNDTISPFRIVYPFRNIISIIKVLQKNRIVFHTFIKKKQYEEALATAIDPLIATILDLREEIEGYYTKIKKDLLTFYTLPLQHDKIIHESFNILDLFLSEFDYPTPQIMLESKQRLKAREEEILAQWHS